jgi:hypothetical protein
MGQALGQTPLALIYSSREPGEILALQLVWQSMAPPKCTCVGGDRCRKQPVCSESSPCNRGLNQKWGKSNGSTLPRNEWRCPQCNAVLRCRSCCDCGEDSGWGGTRCAMASSGAQNAPAATASTFSSPSVPCVMPTAPLPKARATASRSRSPRRMPRLTPKDRGTRYTDEEVKARKARVYELESGSADRGPWPLPGHSVNESELRGKRDAVPYQSVACGLWRDALWLPYVGDVLNSERWITHHQTWSLREEMFITWAHETRMRLVSQGQAPTSASLSREEQRVQCERRREANLVGNIIARSLY